MTSQFVYISKLTECDPKSLIYMGIDEIFEPKNGIGVKLKYTFSKQTVKHYKLIHINTLIMVMFLYHSIILVY